MYRLMGLAHARRSPAPAARCAAARGQGTVEYVALILLVALVMAGVVAAMKGFRTDEGKELGDVILGKIKQAVQAGAVLSGGVRCAGGRPPAVGRATIAGP